VLVVVVDVPGVAMVVVHVVEVTFVRHGDVAAVFAMSVHVPAVLGMDQAVAVVDVVPVGVVDVPVVEEVDMVLVRKRGVAAGHSMEVGMLSVGLMSDGFLFWHRGHHRPAAVSLLA
jgi:hypothetical protein